MSCLITSSYPLKTGYSNTFSPQIYTFILIILCISSNIFVYIRKWLYIWLLLIHKTIHYENSSVRNQS